ncbi:Plastidal glycolate/glycerate translocator 1 like [Actinidia chinensis var. chinensis]|uniref:Plastidal glycolate/glycerate translocator 1 like n=1 Tax=Actinidia chinensis var. chinensis TaxID=1590841 RepID=A0A2R6PHN1_ACTCC|nr:Plastidal glycolate/glycerate translocator 1 like [Actinidia chinensis var. chinensis]
MAIASAIPQTFTLSLPNHHSSRFSTLNYLIPPKKSHRIHPAFVPVAFNGIQISHSPRNFRETALPIRALGHNSKFLQVEPFETRSTRRIQAKSMGSDNNSASTSLQTVFDAMHLIVSLGIVLAIDKALKKAFVAAAIKFPSALFGMFCVFTILMVLDSTVPDAATSLMNFFEPALMFIQRWLPLFYVPSLVVLPLALKDIPTYSGVKICFILVGGWMASLSVAGYTAITVRKLVKTEMIPAEPMSKPSPFSPLELWTWSGIFLVSFAVALLYPTALGTGARTCVPFLLASTVLGHMVGSGLPSDVKKVFHPIICCALSADLAALAFGYFSRSGIDPVLAVVSSDTCPLILVAN